MNFNKYIGAFKNTKQILEGIKNNIFKKEHIEAEAALRWSICKKCILLDKEGHFCMVPGTEPCCGDCGCSLALKTRSLSSSCPVNKWPALMSEDEEEMLNEKLENGGNL